MDKKIIVARIDELMQEKGVTKYQLNENADISTTIYQWRKNAKRDQDRMPSLRSIEKICNFLDVSLAYFFTFDSNQQREIINNELYDAICGLTDQQIKALQMIIKEFK